MSGPSYVEVLWTEVCGGRVDQAMWKYYGLRYVEAEWTKPCGGVMD